MHVYNKLLMNLSEAENVYTLVYIEELSAKSLSLISLKPKKKMKSNIKTGFLGIRINYERFKFGFQTAWVRYTFSCHSIKPAK